MKRLAVLAALAAAGIAFWYLQHRPRTAAAASNEAPAGAARTAGAASPTSRSQPTVAPVDKVTKLANAEERRRLADRIAQAHTARAATHAAPMPRLAETTEDPALPLSKTEIRAAMRELIPHIAECYQTALPTLASPDFKFTAQLTLTGDPDVGTIVDAKALAYPDGTPLPAKLDDCFRSTFQLMALPPLAEGDQLDVNYPFEFRH